MALAVVLHVSDDRLYAVASSHLAPDRRRGDSAGVAERDVETVALDPVAAVAAVGIGTPDLSACEADDLVDLRGQRVAVVGVARQGPGAENELPAFAAFVGGGDAPSDASVFFGLVLACDQMRSCVRPRYAAFTRRGPVWSCADRVHIAYARLN